MDDGEGLKRKAPKRRRTGPRPTRARAGRSWRTSGRRSGGGKTTAIVACVVAAAGGVALVLASGGGSSGGVGVFSPGKTRAEKVEEKARKWTDAMLRPQVEQMTRAGGAPSDKGLKWVYEKQLAHNRKACAMLQSVSERIADHMKKHGWPYSTYERSFVELNERAYQLSKGMVDCGTADENWPTLLRAIESKKKADDAMRKASR